MILADKYFVPYQSDLDTVATWRLLPASMQKVPCGIGELAYKDIHCEVVRRVLDQVGMDRDGSPLRVIVALASNIMYDSWENRQLGSIPRTSSSITAFVELLAKDVHRAFIQLSDSAVNSLARHLREQSP